MPLDRGNAGPISLPQLMELFSRAGVNVTSDIAMGNHYYGGLSINNTNAYDALRMILGSMGVDFVVDDDSRSVRITNLPRRSYTLALNNRTSGYDSNEIGNLDQDGLTSTSSGGSSSEDEEMGIRASNRFWDTLEAEIEARCTILAPGDGQDFTTAQEAIQAQDLDQVLVNTLQQNIASVRQDALEEAFACRHTVNPNTGTITVQAPRWIQEELEEYFDRLN